MAINIKLLDEETWTITIAYGENENARKEEKDVLKKIVRNR